MKATPVDRVRNYSKGMLHTDDSFLFCLKCNIVVDHTKKHKIDKHLESASHTLRAESKRHLKQPSSGRLCHRLKK